MYDKPNLNKVRQQYLLLVKKYVSRRLAQGITRVDLAKELGASSSTLVNIINNGGYGVGIESLMNMYYRAGGEATLNLSLLHFSSETTFKYDQGNNNVQEK